MGFRTLEINSPAELHIRKGQLEVSQEAGTALLAVEDLENIILAGPGIRLSSNALAKLAEADVMVVCCGSDYIPSAVLTSTAPNTRQALLGRQQIAMPQEMKDELWQRIVACKIENQARVLSILGRPNMSEVAAFAQYVEPGDPHNCEASAALTYFPSLHSGLNRRSTDPFNSVLNYGYAVLRSTIVKNIVATGFMACFGIHHENQLNNFNLTDDFIEPFRPMVDLVAPQIVGTKQWLSKEQRHRLVEVLHHACLIEGTKTTALKAIARMVDSFRRAVESGDPGKLLVPTLIRLRRFPRWWSNAHSHTAKTEQQTRNENRVYQVQEALGERRFHDGRSRALYARDCPQKGSCKASAANESSRATHWASRNACPHGKTVEQHRTSHGRTKLSRSPRWRAVQRSSMN